MPCDQVRRSEWLDESTLQVETVDGRFLRYTGIRTVRSPVQQAPRPIPMSCTCHPGPAGLIAYEDAEGHDCVVAAALVARVVDYGDRRVLYLQSGEFLPTARPMDDLLAQYRALTLEPIA